MAYNNGRKLLQAYIDEIGSINSSVLQRVDIYKQLLLIRDGFEKT